MLPAGPHCVGATRAPRADDDWVELLPRTRLQPDTRHLFRIDDAAETTDVRLDVYPDGGMARVRLYGQLAEQGREELVLRWLNLLPDTHARQVLVDDGDLDRADADKLVAARPLEAFPDVPPRLRSASAARPLPDRLDTIGPTRPARRSCL